MKLLAIAFLSMAISLPAATYYVATNGNNSNPGSEAQPWLTLQKAADEMVAGDSTIVLPGTYTHTDYVRFKNAGLPGAPITFFGSSTQAVITGWGFSISNSWIVVQNFYFKRANCSIRTTATNCTLQLNYSDGEGGVNNIGMAFSEPGLRPLYHTIRSNTIINASTIGLSLQGRGHTVEYNTFSAQTGADAIVHSACDTTIRWNLFTNWSRPVGSTDHTDLIQSYNNNGEISTNNIIDGNFAINCDDTQIGNLSDVLLNNTIGDWTWRNNVWVNVEAKMSIYVRDQRFYNNVFYRSGTNAAGPLLFRTSSTKGNAHGGRVYNNLFVICGSNPTSTSQGWWSFGEEDGITLTNFAGDYNLVIGEGAGTSKSSAFTSTNPNGINGQDPSFVSVAAHDFRLQANSPAINTGTNLSALFTTDLSGATRGAQWDMGAFEYTGEPPAPPPAQQRRTHGGRANVGRITSP